MASLRHLRSGPADDVVHIMLLGHAQVLQVVVVPAEVRLRTSKPILISQVSFVSHFVEACASGYRSGSCHDLPTGAHPSQADFHAWCRCPPERCTCAAAARCTAAARRCRRARRPRSTPGGAPPVEFTQNLCQGPTCNHMQEHHTAPQMQAKQGTGQLSAGFSSTSVAGKSPLSTCKIDCSTQGLEQTRV